MPAFEKYRKILSVLLPAGAIGVSFLLSTTALAALPPQSANAQDFKNGPAPVAKRLAAIREADRLVWWGNGGDGAGAQSGGSQ